MAVSVDILLSYLRSTSNLALSCRDFNRKVSSNGFSIRTSKKELCLENLAFYRLLDFPDLDEWMREKVFRAIKDDKPESLQLLLDSGADIEAKDGFGNTSLIWSTRNGRVNCLKMLLQRGANLETKYNEYTALMVATMNGQVNCLKLLLQHGADIEAKDVKGFTALAWAVRNGKLDCLRLLLERGAKVAPELRRKALSILICGKILQPYHKY